DHLSAIVMMGSLLEGLLFDVIRRRSTEASRSRRAPRKDISEWTLEEMINVASDLRWIDQDIRGCAHSLRGFRNLIHRDRQIVSNTRVDRDTVNMCWPAVQAAVNDLTSVLSSTP